MSRTRCPLAVATVKLGAKRTTRGLRSRVERALFPNARGGRIDFRIFGRSTGGRPDQRRHRPGPRALRPAPHLRHVRAPRRRAGVRGLALHRHEHRDDRPPLRPPRPRQPRTRRRAPGRARARAGRGRCVDVDRSRAKRSATAIRGPSAEESRGAWTLGGRRGSFSSPQPTTKGADQQELREAL